MSSPIRRIQLRKARASGIAAPRVKELRRKFDKVDPEGVPYTARQMKDNWFIHTANKG